MTKSGQMPQQLVLWGHSLADYREMFALTDDDLHQSIFDCYPGAASFAAELAGRGGQVIACDELYQYDQATLQQQLKQIFDAMLEQVSRHQDRFVWEKVASLEALIEQRRDGIKRFLSDYTLGKKEQRYIDEDITHTSFFTGEFGLALCSHTLFGYRDEANLDEHLAILTELCRIADEVRVFPLLNSKGDISPLVGPVLLALQQQNLGVEVREVPYHLQKNDNAMMRIWAQSCDL